MCFIKIVCSLLVLVVYGVFLVSCCLEVLDLFAYIATNVISITDGQLYFDAVLFGHAIYSAISIEKSVSRVGAKSLDVFWRSVSFHLYAMVNEYKQELESIVKSLFKVRKHR